MPIKEAPPTPPRQPLLPFVQAVIIVIGVFILMALWLIFTGQKAGEQRGYKNRAVTCDMVAALGLRENPECLTEKVIKYRDRDAATIGTTGAKNSKATMVVACHMARALKIEVPECDGVR